jgi:4-amino-4-deoxy-L-arabinose transferase-like glycosyltransferase
MKSIINGGLSVSVQTENRQPTTPDGLELNPSQLSESGVAATKTTPAAYWWTVALLVVLLLAAGLRLSKLGQSPPGLYVDEAGDAWNAYCLLKTGLDAEGRRWPILYTKGFGANVTTLFMYSLIPFQALGGMNIQTTRLPGALGGILTVLLIYYIGKRLFGPWVGLLAAALLAVNPWHLLESRWGHAATLVPLLITAPLAALLWAGLPLDDEERTPSPWRAALAGAVTGLACYGYQSVRIFLPVFLLSLVLVNWRAWLKLIKTQQGLLAVGALVIAGLVTFGPLLWAHLMDPEINKRGATTLIWNTWDSTGEKVLKVLSRYPPHFGLDFLFIRGDGEMALASPRGSGLFHWYDLPLMLVGFFTLVWNVKRSQAARLLLIWVLLYPVADLLNVHITAHVLRSLPGVCGLVLLAALGAVKLSQYLWQWNRKVAWVAISALLLVAIGLNIRFLSYFYTDFNRQPDKQFAYHIDLLEACAWLKPRLKDVDAVFCTGNYMTHPYIYTLVALNYEPQQWFKDQRKTVEGPLQGGAYKHETVYLQYGKMHFFFDNPSPPALAELKQNGKDDRVVFIVRPGDIELQNQERPASVMRNSLGQATLWILDRHM